MKRKTSLRLQDPHLEREKQRYDAPLPSREWIIELLEQTGVPLKKQALADMLDISDDEYYLFERRLGAMARDGQIHINRRQAVCVASKIDLVKCRVQTKKEGFGFAIPETKGMGDFLLPAKQMQALMDGDTVLIQPDGEDRRGRQTGRVAEILNRAREFIVGRVANEDSVFMLIPEENQLLNHVILKEGERSLPLLVDKIVVAKIITYPDTRTPAIAQVTEVLGGLGDNGLEIEIALRKYDLPREFSADSLEEARKISPKVRGVDIKSRRDLRHLPFVTIDGETAKDFDDAVFAKKAGRSLRLLVAIADVSHYVKPGSALDTEAQQRSTSVYFPRRVIPMLPEKLSNGICSIMPNEERLTMVCDMLIDAKGDIKSYEFYPAVILSHARLTYTQVADWIDNIPESPYQNSLQTLVNIYHKLAKARQKRGAIEFENIETRMIFDNAGKIQKIIPAPRNDAHRLIEECMLAANVCAAHFLQENQHPTLYRNHATPSNEKLTTLKSQLSLLGIKLQGGENPKSKDFAELMQDISGRKDKELIQIMMLRSMQQAVYEPENIGHFGLAYPLYTHFTSPIRRYPDLLIHRAIKAVLAKKNYEVASWEALGKHTSMAERRADAASQEVENWLKTYYMQDKIGEIFSGKISGLTSFGAFVTLNDIYVDGLIHISDLGEDYFHFDAETLSIRGEKSGVSFHIADEVQVLVARADLETKKVDFTLINGGTKSKNSSKTSAQRTKNAGSVKGSSAGKIASSVERSSRAKAESVKSDNAKPSRRNSHTKNASTAKAAGEGKSAGNAKIASGTKRTRSRKTTTKK